ncbi:MAG: class I SAM-dependent methyltransferase [Pseudomonadota bacterium]
MNVEDGNSKSKPLIPVELHGVPETMLWPLWNRAYESQRTDRLIEDPWSVSLVEQLDYDFRRSFGPPNRGHGIRSRVGDDLVRDYLQRHGSDARVVALGEGLETQFLRLGEPDVAWYSVDLPEALEARCSLLPNTDKLEMLPFSALDTGWMDAIRPGAPPFISAMGLFMYFEEQEVAELLTTIAARFPQAELFFDAIPVLFSRKTLRGMQITKDYRAPPMPWGISVDDIASFLGLHGDWDPVFVQTYAQPHPRAMRLYAVLSRIGPIRRKLAPSLVHARARPASGAASTPPSPS